MYKKLLSFFVAFIPLVLVLFLKPNIVSAQTPRDFYDWNSYGVSDNKVLGIAAFAQGKETGNNYKEHNYFLGFLGNLTPDNPFYFTKKLEEGVKTAFTFNPNDRDKLRIEFAGERLTELENMAKRGAVPQQIEGTADNYRQTMLSILSHIENLKKEGKNVSEIAKELDLEAAKHTLGLERLFSKVPLGGAAAGVKNALLASENALDTVADVSGKPAVPQEVVDRLQALKAQGILSSEEVSKIVAVKSRQDAREELRKYADERIIPQADFKKLDETARINFPAEYFKTLELKKFEELKDLETQKPDPQTLSKLQQFAKTYKSGETVPSELRRWWVPMIRLEELQNTIRPDLIDKDQFQYRPEDQQKYKELVERVKPRQEDIKYVNDLVKENPNLLNDPSYARIKAFADSFGTSSDTKITTKPPASACGTDSHWVSIPFMPNGGYCVPNIVYANTNISGSTTPCPPGYHRNDPQGACYPDNPTGTGLTGIILNAPGSCPAGYSWISNSSSPRGGYCSPEYSGVGGGAYPAPIAPPAYCPAGQIFADGKCQTYNPPPTTGCPAGQYWTGSVCTAPRDCGVGYYQGSDGTCKPTSQYQTPNPGGTCSAPANGCGFNAYFDYASCSCKSTLDHPQPTSGPGSTSCQAPSGGCPSGWYWNANVCSCNPSTGTTVAPSQCKEPSGGCPSGWSWVQSACSCNYTGGSGGGSTCTKSPADCTANGGYLDYASCNCKTSSYGTPSGTYGTPSYQTPSGDHSCGSGYYWNGSYCAPSSGGSYGTPSSSYGTPSYGTPSYGTPSYGTPPPYSTPSYGTPSYGTPSYETPH